MQPDLRVADTSATLPVETNKVLRNTYLMLGLTMIPTVIGAFIGVSLNFAFMAASPMLSVVVLLAVLFGLNWAIAANRNNALGVALLLVMTFLLGVMLGPILQRALHFRNGAQLIGMAAGGTSVIFMTLANVAAVTKKDFSFLGKFLVVGLVLLIIASIANAIFQVPSVHLALASIGVLIFSGFILYDVSRVVTGGETNYVMATLAIYLDIYNLFVRLLQLLMALAGERD